MKSSKTPKMIISHGPLSKSRSWNFFRIFGIIILVKSLFSTIRFINRTNSRPIWTRTGEEWYYWKKVEAGVTVSPPKKKRTIVDWNVDHIKVHPKLYRFWFYHPFVRFETKEILGDESYCNEYPGISYSNSSWKLELRKKWICRELVEGENCIHPFSESTSKCK